MKRAMAIAAGVIATIATALHADEPPRFNESHVSGIHDMTVLLGSSYEFEPLCVTQEPVTEPGRLPVFSRRPCGPKDEWNEWKARYLLGDPRRH